MSDYRNNTQIDYVRNFKPKPILIDFEIDAKMAIEEFYPACAIKGCHFHFKQCLKKEIQRIQKNKILTAISSSCADDIVRDDFETPTADGNYRWALQTEEGIYHEQQGTSTEEGLAVQGQYQYTAPDGQIINVVYRADGSGGFRAEGAHLPTPPPIPPAIQRALDYLARLDSHNNRI